MYINGIFAVSLWSASGYTGAFMRASNVIYETPEGRPFWKLQLAIPFVMIVLLALLAVSLVMTGPIVSASTEPLGIGSTTVDVWNIAKWPAMAAVFLLMLAVLYYASPNLKLRGSNKADACEKAAAALSGLGQCLAIPAKLAEGEGRERLVEGLRGRFEALDILVNDAGAVWGAPLGGTQWSPSTRCSG